MDEYILFGTGDRGKRTYQLLKANNIEIAFWIDSNCDKWGKELFGKPIYSPEAVKGREAIKVCISAVDENEEMWNILLSKGVKETQIVYFHQMIIDAFLINYKGVQIDRDLNKRDATFLDCTNGLHLGGVEAWSMDLLIKLKTRNVDISIIAPYGEYSISDVVKENVLFIDIDPQKIFSYENMRSIIESLARNIPCVIVTNCVNDLFLSACVMKSLYPDKINIISVIHQGLDYVYKENCFLDKYINAYVCVSEDIKSGLLKRGINASKIFHMTCPVECEKKLVREYTESKEKPIKIGYAGRFDILQKRMDLLQLFLIELEKRKVDYYLELAGAGSYEIEFRKFILENKLTDKVKVIGRLPRIKMQDFWLKQDICINVSDFEGRSISNMEAMAYGAVPVVTATSGVREDITDGENGFVVALRDYIEMAIKVQYLAENRQLLKKMGIKAHDVIYQKNEKEDHVAFWEHLLRNNV